MGNGDTYRSDNRILDGAEQLELQKSDIIAKN